MWQSNPDRTSTSTPLIVLAAAVMAYLGIVAANFGALTDYVLFAVEYASEKISLHLFLQLLLSAALYLIFIELYSRFVIGLFGLPDRDRNILTLVLDLFARCIIIGTPSFIFIILLMEIKDSIGGNLVIWLTLAILYLGLYYQVNIAITCHPIKVWVLKTDFGSILLPQSQLLDRLSFFAPRVAFMVAVALYIWLWADTVASARFIGGVGIILLFGIALLLAARSLILLRTRIRTSTGWIILALIVTHLIGETPLEFRHGKAQKEEKPADSHRLPTTSEEMARARGVPSVSDSFENWLRSRPKFQESVTSPNPKKYPVFIVSAQGGGQYAAYHTALSLARLYDQCPKLKDHVFAISSVSGGSVGAAVFTELLRAQGSLGDSCSLAPEGEGNLERYVRQFFADDFVTPVAASAFLFDTPNLFVPQLRIGHDRATTLELALERSWQNLGLSREKVGLDQPLYGRWSENGIAPALFLNMTSSNYGSPFVASELYMGASSDQSRTNKMMVASLVLAKKKSVSESERRKADLATRILIHSIRSREYLRPQYYNILEFKSDIQMNLSTAVVMSARFPYVTPSGVLVRDSKIGAIDMTLRETTALQLIDGGFWDNSGVGTALEIVRQLKTANLTKSIENIDFNLISFGHSNSALQKSGTRGAQADLVTPIATFEAVRQARRYGSNDAKAAGYTHVHAIELFDDAFQAPLSWTLSKSMRKGIEARSGGTAEPTLCCELKFSDVFDLLSLEKIDIFKLINLRSPNVVVDLDMLGRLSRMEASINSKIAVGKKFVPNKEHFEQIVKTIVSDEDQTK